MAGWRPLKRREFVRKLRALGFVDNVAELMRASDLLATKAGGVTLAEAFCCGLPVVVHDVLAGQEGPEAQTCRSPGLDRA